MQINRPIINNQSLIQSSDVQLTLTLRITTTKVVKTLVSMKNRTIQALHPNNHISINYKLLTSISFWNICLEWNLTKKCRQRKWHVVFCSERNVSETYVTETNFLLLTSVLCNNIADIPIAVRSKVVCAYTCTLGFKNQVKCFDTAFTFLQYTSCQYHFN